jgi:heme/copper-type cytochrome/quinol oxidase subunit 3
MRQHIVANIGDLPLHGQKSASMTWWGTLAFMLIEGTGFALMIGVYLYLGSLAPEWPINAPPPDLGPGTGVTLLLLASLVPNWLLGRWAAAQDLRRVRIGLLLMAAFGAAPMVLRIWEFAALNVAWDANAYGSTVWVLLGLHTTHIITDLGETFVLCAMMFSRHADNPRRFGDVQDGVLYWYFVVLTWLPIYAVLYGIPRL